MKNTVTTDQQGPGSLRRTAVFPQVLVMTMSLLLFGGGGEAFSIEKGLKGVVSGGARAKNAGDIAERIDEAREEAAEEFFDYRRLLYELTNDYDTTPEEVEAFFVEFNEDWSKHHDRLVGLRFDLRSQLRNGEWQRLFANLREQRAN